MDTIWYGEVRPDIHVCQSDSTAVVFVHADKLELHVVSYFFIIVKSSSNAVTFHQRLREFLSFWVRIYWNEPFFFVLFSYTYSHIEQLLWP